MLYAGRHDTTLSGRSPDFREFRAYRPGENAALIDWRATAKRQSALVRERVHEGEVGVWVLPDTSASMDFPETENTKQEIQMLLVGAILHLMSGHGDPVGMSFSTPRGDTLSYRPRRSREGLAELVRDLAESVRHNEGKPGEAQDARRHSPAESARMLAGRLRAPAVIFILTDFADENAAEQAKLYANLQARGHDVRILHLFHPYERNLPWRGDCSFEDLEESLDDLRADPSRIRELYERAYDEHVETVRENLKDTGVLYHNLNVTRPVGEHLMRLFGEDA